MKTNTCGECRYCKPIGPHDDNECHANPPVIVDAIVRHEISTEYPDADFRSMIGSSYRPEVCEVDIACRFFVEGGE